MNNIQAIECPKCGSNMIFIVYNRTWYCLNDGTEIPQVEAAEIVRYDSPVLEGWREYFE